MRTVTHRLQTAGLPTCCLFLCITLHAQDMPLSQVLIDGESWELVSQGHQFTDGFTTDQKGNFYFADVLGGTTIERIDPAGNVTTVATDAPRISGMHIGPDGKLYACQGGTFGRIVVFDLEEGSMEVVTEGVKPNDLVVTQDGHLYFTETPKMQISHLAPGKSKPTAASVSTKKEGPQRPNGIALSPDQGTLAVSDHGGRYTWVWRIEPNGKLTQRQPYMTLRLPGPDLPSKGDGMTTDQSGRYYVTSAVGIQMFDPTGRMGGVIASPTESPIVSVTFAGPDHAYLYVASGDQIYRRKTKARGFANAVTQSSGEE